jgi:hypothetical protein
LTIKLTGGCLCEAVRYVCSAPPVRTVHCYCKDCRKIGGTGHATHTVFPEDAFELIGSVTEFVKNADSGNSIKRRFCPECGSAIFHTREGLEGFVVVRASSLDEPESVRPELAVFVSRAVSWDHVDRGLICHDEMLPPSK